MAKKRNRSRQQAPVQPPQMQYGYGQPMLPQQYGYGQPMLPHQMQPTQHLQPTHQMQYGYGQPMQHMQPMQMQPQEVNAEAADDDDDDEESDDNTPKYNKSKKADLCNSSGLLWQLPRVRLQEIIEGVEVMCDPILTSGLSQKGCAMMMWLLTGSRPDTSISSCRAKTYKKLCEKMIVAQVRHKRCIGDGRYQEVVQKLCKNN